MKYHWESWTLEQWSESSGIRLELLKEVSRRLVNHQMADRHLALANGKFYLTTDDYGVPRFHLPKVDADSPDSVIFEEAVRAVEAAGRCLPD